MTALMPSSSAALLVGTLATILACGDRRMRVRRF
jgi:hypothetical protein